MLNDTTINDYLLSTEKRADEQLLSNVDSMAYIHAMFYMYGACEGLNEDKVLAHNLLRKNAQWDGTLIEAEKYLTKQIVVSLEDDAEEDLS